MENILLNLKDQITKKFSNFENFNIFKGNKRILLFLIKNNFITINESIALIMMSHKIEKYPEHFFNEIKPFHNDEIVKEISDQIPEEKHEENREIGENDSYICRLIQNDSIDEFTSFVKKTEISFSTRFDPSIYETNKFLVNRRFLLTEYAAFFGSIQILKYFFESKAKISPYI